MTIQPSRPPSVPLMVIVPSTFAHGPTAPMTISTRLAAAHRARFTPEPSPRRSYVSLTHRYNGCEGPLRELADHTGDLFDRRDSREAKPQTVASHRGHSLVDGSAEELLRRGFHQRPDPALDGQDLVDGHASVIPGARALEAPLRAVQRRPPGLVFEPRFAKLLHGGFVRLTTM